MVLALSVLLVSPANAQDSPHPGLILRLSASARTLGMGNVGVTGRDDDVLFYNPAQLVAARGTSLSVEQFSTISRVGALSSVGRFSTGGIAIGAAFADFRAPGGAYPIERADLVAGGPNFGSSANLAVGIGQVIKRTRIGLAVKYIDERIGTARNSTVAADIGVARDFFNTAFGLAVQNIGGPFGTMHVLLDPSSSSRTRIEPAHAMPVRVTLGAGRSLPMGEFDVTATAAVSYLHEGFVAPAAGGEIGYSWLDGYSIVARAGARRPERGESPFTGGAGFVMDRLAIDYAIEGVAGRTAHRFGVRIR
jgi:hypothetical protein